MLQDDYIELDAMALTLSVGILDREYKQRQIVEFRLRLGLDLDPCGESGDLRRSVNYADVLEQTPD